MKAYHNDEAIKAKYISRVKAHQEADEIIQGQYWENGKGCAVGCTLHSANHCAYESELGIPRILARLEDGIFEGLPNEVAKEFPLKFLNAVQVGSDLSGVFPKFMHWLLVDEKHGVINHASTHHSKNVINNVASLYKRKIDGEKVNSDEWRATTATTADAATTAADAAHAAYAAATTATTAAHAAHAAYAAAYAADAAAHAYADAYAYASADAAADASADASAAASAAAYAYAYASAASAAADARIIQSKKLLQLIEGAELWV